MADPSGEQWSISLSLNVEPTTEVAAIERVTSALSRIVSALVTDHDLWPTHCSVYRIDADEASEP